jgi:hypothetical protein
MSNRSDAIQSDEASPEVSRSRSNVPNLWSFSRMATIRFPGLNRLLPLPWAKITSPLAPAGMDRSPCRIAPAQGIPTSSLVNLVIQVFMVSHWLTGHWLF